MTLGRMQQRRDTAANWASNNPTLAAGEVGIDTTNNLLKVGDGSTAWASLAAWAQVGFLVAGGALGTPSSGTLTNCTFPTLNQNTTGTASNVTGTVAIANGGTGATTLAGAGILVSGGALGTPASGNASNLTSFPTLNQNTTGTAAVATKWVPRVGTTASSATPSIDASLYEQYNITALAAAITSVTVTNPAEGLKLTIRIKDNGTARAIALGSSFRALGAALPTTTVLSKTLYIGCIYNGADTVWDVVAVAQEA
jgi:hypothetical protein